MTRYTHPIFGEVIEKLDDKTIDPSTIWATSFEARYRHYIITDDAEYQLISDHDHYVLMDYDDALRAAYKELGLCLTPARAAKRDEKIERKLRDRKPVVTAADAARIATEYQRHRDIAADILARRQQS